MDMLIAAIAAKLNLPQPIIRKALSVVLQQARPHAPADAFQSVVDKLGVAPLLEEPPPQAPAGGSLMSGLLGKAGDLMGKGGTGKLLSVASSLQAAGLPMDRIPDFGRALREEGEAAAGDDFRTVSDALKGVFGR